MCRNGQNSTSGQICNPKFKIRMGCFLFEYEFWWFFRQDLYVFLAKMAFIMKNFQNSGAGGGWVDHFSTKPPKGTSLADFSVLSH